MSTKTEYIERNLVTVTRSHLFPTFFLFISLPAEEKAISEIIAVILWPKRIFDATQVVNNVPNRSKIIH